MNTKLVYLDYNSTTPVDQRVINMMQEYFNLYYGNPSSSYAFGDKAKLAMKTSKLNISSLLGGEFDDFFFTSGATESINLALKGLALSPNNQKKHIITSKTEHKAVLQTCNYLENIGFEIDYISVNKDGVIDLDLLKSLIKSNTLAICLMWVNNETGVINSINKIGKIARDNNVYFICDGTQGVGKIPINITDSNIDILCFSGHKTYAPKGIGGIYINNKIIKDKLITPLIHGGGQQNGLRSGTENVPLIVGLGSAFSIAAQEMNENKEKIEKLKNIVENELLKINGAKINGDKINRIYNTTNVCIPNFETEIFLGVNKDIALSNGSACNSSLIQPSHVLTSMGLSNDEAMSSLRISLGKENTEEDIYIFLKRIHNFIEM